MPNKRGSQKRKKRRKKKVLVHIIYVYQMPILVSFFHSFIFLTANGFMAIHGVGSLNQTSSIFYEKCNNLLTSWPIFILGCLAKQRPKSTERQKKKKKQSMITISTFPVWRFSICLVIEVDSSACRRRHRTIGFDSFARTLHLNKEYALLGHVVFTL